MPGCFPPSSRRAKRNGSLGTGTASLRFGADQRERILAVPLRRAGHRAYGAAVLAEEDGCWQPQRLAVLLQRREHIAGAVGVEGEVLHPDFLQEGLWPVKPRRIDVDGHHLKIRAANFRLKPVERRHLAPAGDAPCRPEIEENVAA